MFEKSLRKQHKRLDVQRVYAGRLCTKQNEVWICSIQSCFLWRHESHNYTRIICAFMHEWCFK